MYKRGAKGWLKHIDFILCDVIALLLAFVAACLLRFGRFDGYIQELYNGFLLLLIFFDVLIGIVFNTMHNVLRRGYYREFAETVKHALLVFVVLTVYLVSAKTSTLYSRIVIYTTFALHIVFSYVIRIMYKSVLRKRIVGEKRSILVVSSENTAASIVKNLVGNMNDSMRVAGIVLTDRDGTGEVIADIQVVANLDDAARYICREWIDEVFLDDAHHTEKTAKLSRQCSEMGVVIHECVALEQRVNQKQFVENLAGYTVLTSSVNYMTPLQMILKRAMDIAGGLVGCMAALLIIAIVGPKIKKESPGPILYSQERIGQNGRRFKFYKIRSMYLDADERKKELMSQNRVADGMMFKLDFDPRIIGNQILPDGTKKTGIGAFIRNTSLDEFPQFFNVLKGEMSLVGTRPPTVDEWEKYELHHRARLAMKPGLTGMWQVSGRSSITDFEEIVKLDTQYICNWSLSLDMRILFKTVMAVLHKDGAM